MWEFGTMHGNMFIGHLIILYHDLVFVGPILHVIKSMNSCKGPLKVLYICTASIILPTIKKVQQGKAVFIPYSSSHTEPFQSRILIAQLLHFSVIYSVVYFLAIHFTRFTHGCCSTCWLSCGERRPLKLHNTTIVILEYFCLSAILVLLYLCFFCRLRATLATVIKEHTTHLRISAENDLV